jgi:hypothetical protein
VVFTGKMISLITSEFKRTAAAGIEASQTLAGEKVTVEAAEAVLATANQSPPPVLSLLKEDSAQGNPIIGDATPQATEEAVKAPPPPADTEATFQGQAEHKTAWRYNDTGRLHMMAVAARATDIRSNPQLHIRENDLRILGRLDRDREQSDDPLDGAFAGVSVVLEFNEGDACVMVQDNRVRLDTTFAPAAGVFFAEFCSITGNMQIQPIKRGRRTAGATPGPDDDGVYCLLAYDDFVDGISPRLEVMANLVHGDAYLNPPRLEPPSSEWNSVNELRNLKP